MRRSFYLVILMALLIGLLIPTTTLADGEEATVDVIVLAEGPTDGLVSYIRSLGGTINFQYKNVFAVAATIPASKLGDISSFSGVTSVEKDRMVYLYDELEGGKNDVHPMAYEAESLEGVEVQSVDLSNINVNVMPEGYANFLYTGAIDVWDEIGAGEGSIVAVVDTGTVPNTCIGHAVIGAPGFPDGYNAVGDGIPATSPLNFWHGTHVGGMIASSCALDFSAAPTHPIYLAQAEYLGWPIDFVPIVGQAPGAKLYPVKVFPADGSGVPSSIILKGLDHVLTLKKDGLLDIDIVNMSLGGPTVWDGRDAYDRFMVELVAEDILVVTSTSNSGPIPNSMGSPATSFATISVGALDYAPSSRTFYEYLGLAVWPGASGQGLVMRPTTETRVVNFSGRGPMSDGRAAVDVVALGHWTFQEGPNYELRWAGGTSFSAPTVAGAAALLDAYWERLGHETNPIYLRNVLLRGADPDAVDPLWRDVNTQGWGTLDIPSSLNLLKRSPWRMARIIRTGELEPNILPSPIYGAEDTWESDTITLAPSENYDLVFEISEDTSIVTIEAFDIVIPDNWDYAFWANAIEVHLQSAKRTDFVHPIEYYWYPWYGSSFDIVVEDGPWTLAGSLEAYQPMEPGLMKFSLIGDYSNESPVSFKVRVTRENFRVPLTDPVATGIIRFGESIVIPVDIPQGTSTATFDLDWERKWDRFPTSDIDMIIYDPTFALASIDGATGNAPERVVLESPMGGTWYVVIDAYEVYRPDLYNLYLTLE